MRAIVRGAPSTTGLPRRKGTTSLDRMIPRTAIDPAWLESHPEQSGRLYIRTFIEKEAPEEVQEQGAAGDDERGDGELDEEDLYLD